jgi:hypothetical protein
MALPGEKKLTLEVLQPLQELWEVDKVLPGGARLTLEWRYSSPSRIGVRSSHDSARRVKAHL